MGRTLLQDYRPDLTVENTATLSTPALSAGPALGVVGDRRYVLFFHSSTFEFQMLTVEAGITTGPTSLDAGATYALSRHAVATPSGKLIACGTRLEGAQLVVDVLRIDPIAATVDTLVIATPDDELSPECHIASAGDRIALRWLTFPDGFRATWVALLDAEGLALTVGPRQVRLDRRLSWVGFAATDTHLVGIIPSEDYAAILDPVRLSDLEPLEPCAVDVAGATQFDFGVSVTASPDSLFVGVAPVVGGSFTVRLRKLAPLEL